MTVTRIFARSAAVLGAATALTVAGAGAAMATTSENTVDGNDVSVTFELDGGLLDGDACGAALVPPTAIAGLAGTIGEIANGDPATAIPAIFSALDATDGVIALKDGISPVVALAPVLNPSGTVSAEDVPSNLYMLITICGSDLLDEDFAPNIEPMLVGNPLDALNTMSSDGILETGSALLQGDDDSGLGGILSSAIGGGEGGDLLGTLSSATGDAE
ncbi:hypothetical protein [Dietzia aurantiaca]|uniref:Secreted protein n=1 Tax=Dietzia aurantiaca TaxID=983873 RepID=A0ABV9PS61_9ACTN